MSKAVGLIAAGGVLLFGGCDREEAPGTAVREPPAAQELSADRTPAAPSAGSEKARFWKPIEY